jgi:hypothetical protein
MNLNDLNKCFLLPDNNLELKNKDNDVNDVIKDPPKSESKEQTNLDAKAVDLPRKKEISLTNILCKAFRKNFELFEMDGVAKGGKGMGQEEREKSRERFCGWIYGCCSLLSLMCCHSGADSAQQITGKIALVFIEMLLTFPIQFCPGAHVYHADIVYMRFTMLNNLQVKV